MALKDIHMTLYHRMTSKTLCLRLVTYTSLDPVEHLVGLCTLETTQQFGHTFCNNIREAYSGPFFFLVLIK